MDANAMLSLLLPDGILKRFEFVKCYQEDTGRKDLLSDGNVIQINIYLDGRDNRTEEEKKGAVEKIRVTADQTAGAWPKILPIRNMKKAGSSTPLTKERKALMSEFMDSAAALVERATK